MFILCNVRSFTCCAFEMGPNAHETDSSRVSSFNGRPTTAALDFLFFSSPGDGPVGHPCEADSRVRCGISVQDSGSEVSLQHMIGQNNKDWNKNITCMSTHIHRHYL